MPSKPPAPSAWSNRGRRPWLLVGLSVRALAQAAARGGHDACALDAFCDRDTVAACGGRAAKLPLGAGYRIEAAALASAAAAARRRFAPDGFAGIVYAGGLDGRADLLAALADVGDLAGCSGETMRALREPASWFALLDALGVPHPPIRRTQPACVRGWLVKSAAGSGGWHVRRWQRTMALAEDGYYQQHAAGRPASALFVADGRRSRVLGWQWQLLASSAELPWRYGGVMTAPDLPTAARERVAEAIDAIVARVPLVGLASLDFLCNGDDVAVLELNPRPTASIALYPQADLFACHVEAGAAVFAAPKSTADASVRGEAVVYAPQPIRIGPDWRWPDHCADLPAAGAEFARGEPVCSVAAEAGSILSLRRRLCSRRRSLLNSLTENLPHDYPHFERQRPDCTARTGAAG